MMIGQGGIAKFAPYGSLSLRRWTAELDELDVPVTVEVCETWNSPVFRQTNKTIGVNYNELTTSSLEIIVSRGNHPQMALIQVSELLSFTQNYLEPDWAVSKLIGSMPDTGLVVLRSHFSAFRYFGIDMWSECDQWNSYGIIYVMLE